MTTKNEWTHLAIGAAFALIGVVILFFLLSCDDNDGCTKEETRCQGPVWQICNEDQNWEAIEDCTTIEPGAWACCPKDGIEGCNLVEECERQPLWNS